MQGKSTKILKCRKSHEQIPNENTNKLNKYKNYIKYQIDIAQLFDSLEFSVNKWIYVQIMSNNWLI